MALRLLRDFRAGDHLAASGCACPATSTTHYLLQGCLPLQWCYRQSDRSWKSRLTCCPPTHTLRLLSTFFLLHFFTSSGSDLGQIRVLASSQASISMMVKKIAKGRFFCHCFVTNDAPYRTTQRAVGTTVFCVSFLCRSISNDHCCCCAGCLNKTTANNITLRVH